MADKPEASDVGSEQPDDAKLDVEQAVANQRERRGDPAPYRSGLGRASLEDAELVDYHRTAKRNGTTVGQALHDLTSVETAARQDPLLGIEALSQKMGWDSAKVAGAYAQQHGYFRDRGPEYEPTTDIKHQAKVYNDRAEMQRMIDHEASHPANAFLKSPEFAQWGMNFIHQEMPDGRPVIDHMLEKLSARERVQLVANAYRRETLQQKANEREATRQADMETAEAHAKSLHNRAAH